MSQLISASYVLYRVRGFFRNGAHASPPPPCGSMAPAMRASLFPLNIFLSLLPTGADDLAAGACTVAEGQRMRRISCWTAAALFVRDGGAEFRQSARSICPSLLSCAPLLGQDCLEEHLIGARTGHFGGSPIPVSGVLQGP